MDDIELLGIPHSTFVRTVRIACEEKGVPYRLIPVMPHTPEVLAVNPFGKIPAMRHGDLRLFESLAILGYVDRAFPGPKLFPQDAVECGRVLQWVSGVSSNLQPRMSGYLQGYYFSAAPDGSPDRAQIDAALPGMTAGLTMLDAVLSTSAHLATESFSLADMCLIPNLYWLIQCPEARAAIGSARYLSRYYDQVSQRPSVRATEPPPFEELVKARNGNAPR
ncbi:MAG TPA: glutathione S-transferase family protein [Steroidobacteraceae bacterium]|jgi:glutathione S-transferase